MVKQSFRLWILAALAFLPALPAMAGVGRWTPYGPPEGFLVTAAADEDRLYAATEESGIYASDDRGITWFRSSAGISNERIEALAVDPDDTEIYAAGQRRFFRSDDAGAHWTLLGSLPPQGQPGISDVLALAPGEPDVFFLAIGQVLYRSTDQGESWIPVLPWTSNIQAILVDPNDADSIFVGTAQPAGNLLHSANGGTSWAPVTVVLPAPDLQPSQLPFSFGVTEIAAAATTPTTLFALSGQRLYRSTDAGESWGYIAAPEVAPGLPGSADSVVATPGPQARVYVFQQNALVPFREKLFVSEDLGATWTLVTETARGSNLRLDPVTGGLFSFSISGLGITEDEGVTWRPAPLGNQSCGLTFPRPTPKVRFAPGRTYTVVGGRLWVSRNGQQSWSVLGQDLADQCLAIRDVAVDSRPGVLWAAAYDGVYRSSNGGTTWIRSLGPLVSGEALPFQGITLLDSQTILLSGYGIWRSGDRGATWKRTLAGNVVHDEFDEPGFTRSVYRIRVDPENPLIVYAGVVERGERHPPRTLPYVYQSLDGGRTWRRISDQGYALAIDPSAPRTLYLGTREGILRSRDRGRHWTRISDFDLGTDEPYIPNGSDLLVDPRDPRVLYAARGDRAEDLGVWRSVDGGATWSPLRTGLDSLPAFELFPDPRRPGRLFVASEGLFEGIFALPGS